MNRTFQQNAGRGCVKKNLSASLAEEFGLGLFKKKAGKHADRILAELGTYSRGKRKGLQKGFIHWVKVVEGGFDYYGSRSVVYRGSFDYRVTKEFGVRHEDCEIRLDFDQQHAALSIRLKEAQAKHDDLVAETPILESQLERAISDNLEDFYVEISKDLLENNSNKIQKLKDRIVKMNDENDALINGIKYLP